MGVIASPLFLSLELEVCNINYDVDIYNYDYNENATYHKYSSEEGIIVGMWSGEVESSKRDEGSDDRIF